jgi:RNA polymerase sigma factor (sigma-70 family)
MDNKQEQHVLLWNSFKRGDWEAYTRLYHAYYRLLNNYGHKFTKDVNLIEDSVHDLFVTLWTNRNNLGNPLSVKNYLYKSIRNILLKKIKIASRIFHLEEDNESIPFVVSFDHQLISNEEEKRLQQTINEVLNKLPSRQQEIIFLRFYESLSYEEAADIMGIHVSSAYKLLYKALENVQQSLTYTGLGVLTILLKILNNDPSHTPLDQATSGSLVFSLPQ